MSGQLHPPLLTPTQASNLLDQVLYEQVVECVDLDALRQLEQSLVMLVGELDGVDDEQVIATARVMLDRALLRLPGGIRGYLHASGWPFDGCELCEAEAREDEAREGDVRVARPHSSVPLSGAAGSTGDRARAGRRRPS